MRRLRRVRLTRGVQIDRGWANATRPLNREKRGALALTPSPH